jgi:hypothetical protein
MNVRKLFILLLFLFVLPTFAQSETFVDPIVGISVDVPEDWYVSSATFGEIGLLAVSISDSSATVNSLGANNTMESGEFTLLLLSPRIFLVVGDSLEEIASKWMATADWQDVNLDSRPALQWSYQDARTQGFVLIYEMPSGYYSVAIVDTAPNEMEEYEADFMDILATIDYIPYIIPEGEALELSETADEENLSFTFNYPEKWYIQEADDIPFGILLSTHVFGTEAQGYSGELVMFVLDEILPPNWTEEDSTLELIEGFATTAENSGITTNTPEVLIVDGLEIGRLIYTSENLLIMLRILDDERLVRIAAFYADSELAMFEPTIIEIIKSVELPSDNRTNSILNAVSSIRNSSPALFAELSETYVSENEVVFDYPENWSIYEEAGLILLANTAEVADFTAQDDEFMFIIAALPASEMSMAELLILIQDAAPQNARSFELNDFRINDKEADFDISFDLGLPGTDFNFMGAGISNAEVTGLIYLIYDQSHNEAAFLLEMLNPVLNSVGLEDN